LTDTVVGKIIYEKFRNDDFSIVVVQLAGGDTITVKGYHLPTDNMTYEFSGTITDDKKYGPTLSCDIYNIVARDKNNIVKFIAKNIDGIGKVTANKFYDMYGMDTFDALKDLDKIQKVIKSKRTAEKVFQSASIVFIDKDVLFTLMKYDISNKVINDIVTDENMNITKDILTNNPFVLNRYKIGFLKLNKMAIDFQCNLKSYERISSCILYFLRDYISLSGHVFIDYGNLIQGAIKLLNKDVPKENFCTKDDVNSVLHALRHNKELIVEKLKDKSLRIYDAESFTEENGIAETLIKLVKKQPTKHYSTEVIKEYIQKYEKIYNVNLSEKQKLAIKTVMNNNVCVITGSAGTGKTTVLKFCIDVYKELYNSNNICLLAPTGRAARRMSEATKWEAKTIHSKLAIDNEGAVNQEIDEDIVFIDEMSMTGSSLFYKILNNAAPHTKFVFLGDPQQLPSVESGNVLSDIINSGIVPVVKLDVIYRQCLNSLIISNANKIIKGIRDFDTGPDFVFIDKTGSENIQKETVDVLKDELFNGNLDLDNIQIITPMREKGYLSAKQINYACQNLINPLRTGQISFKANGYEFRTYDKIICQKNTDDIKNGDIGFIEAIYKEDNTIKADVSFYGGTFDLTLTKENFKELNFALAYAITVHKSQGSEFQVVILPVSNENKIMLKRNLLYTAVTRASDKMMIIGSRIHYWDAVSNNVITPRNTALTGRLQKKFLNN
jgi:exodeoxyribonuclease V alpha subunit